MSYNGISSIPRKQDEGSAYLTSALDEMINVCSLENLPLIRLSYHPDDTRFPWDMQIQFVQYLLDNYPYEIIVDYYHLAPVSMTEAQWLDSVNKGLQILEIFSDYQDRLWLEPQNEQKFTSTHVSKIQGLIDQMRAQGYSNKLVSNVFWEPYITAMAAVDDPLDKFYTGQHIYFYSNTTKNWRLFDTEIGTQHIATKWMQDALDAGLKIVNTEIGADASSTSYFNADKVQLVNDFMAWCTPKGISNNVWMMYGDYNYPYYKTLGLEFPESITPPPIPLNIVYYSEPVSVPVTINDALVSPSSIVTVPENSVVSIKASKKVSV